MKKSEILEEKAEREDNDLTALGLHTKALREKRSERFEEAWLELIKSHINIVKRDNGSYTFSTHKYGVMDYYPKANKLLMRRTGKWIKPGMKFIIDKIIKPKQEKKKLKRRGK